MSAKLTFLSLIASPAMAILALGACLPAVDSDDTIPEDFQVTIEKTACHGTCPVYTLTVSADGTVTYDGMDFVEVAGQQTTSISESEVIALFNAVQTADFFSLEDSYTILATDLPSTTMTVTVNGTTKSVYHYGFGCEGSDSAPSELCELEVLTEDIAISNGWVASI